MALSSLFRKDKRVIIGFRASILEQSFLTVDAALTITHEMGGQATKSEIEDGSSISDHVTLDNKKVVLDGVVSDAPLEKFTAARGLANVIVGQVAREAFGPLLGAAATLGAGVINAQLLDTGASRSKDAFVILETIRDQRILCSLTSGLKSYGLRNFVSLTQKGLLLTNLTIPRTAEIGESLRFTATFEEVTIVQSFSVTVPKSIVTVPGGASNAKLGGAKATQVDQATNDTALFKLLNLGGT